MAQAGFTPISLFHSTTAAAVPTSGNLVAGELALNTVDEKLYFKNSAGTVKQIAGVGVGGIVYTAVKTANYTAVNNDGVLTNTTGGAFTVTLPATPATGTQVFIADSAGTWGTNNLTIGRNGSTIEGSATDLVCDINSVSIQCVYNGTTWDIFAQIGANNTAVVTLNGTQTLTNKTLTSPILTTPTLGVATATSLQGIIGNVTPAAGSFTSLTASTTLGVTGLSTLTAGAVVEGLTVGRGAGAVSTNTAVGASALAANTTGTQNSAFGYQALLTNITGANNTAIGEGTLQVVTVSDNTAVGSGALRFTTTGSGNSSVGRLALFVNTTGSNNVAVGTSALQSNTTASYNTAVGYQAGYNNTTGGVTAFGESALRTSTTGAGNVAFGSNAGYSMATNSYSTYIGHFTGYNTTGGGNVFIGNSGSNGSAGCGYYMTSGDNNIIVGGFTGNSDGLDIRTSNAYAVISDGLGRRQITMAEGQTLALDSAVPNAGTGITFPATQSASSNANTLDDYEEGTFTPTWTPSTSGTITLYSTYSTLAYTKVGRVVTITGANTIQSVSSPVGTSVNITGLPFAAGATFVHSSGTVALDQNTKTGVGIRVSNTSTSIDFYVNASTLGTNSDYAFAFSYITAT